MFLPNKHQITYNNVTALIIYRHRHGIVTHKMSYSIPQKNIFSDCLLDREALNIHVHGAAQETLSHVFNI